MQSGCVVPAQDAVTVPPSDPGCASPPMLVSGAASLDVAFPCPEVLASMDEVVPPLEPAIPAAAPPEPLALAVEPAAPVAAPPRPLVLAPEPIAAFPPSLDEPIAAPLAPEYPEPLPVWPQAANESPVKRPTGISALMGRACLVRRRSSRNHGRRPKKVIAGGVLA